MIASERVPELNSSLREYVAQFTELEPLGSIRDTGGWYHTKCILPGCEDPAQSLYVFSDGNRDSFMCSKCESSGGLDEFKALKEHGEVVSIYSRQTDGEFGENKPNLPIKTVEEVLEEAGEGPDWVQESTAARGAVTEFSGLAKKGGKTTFWVTSIAAGARGEDHAGFATTPAKYLYLTEQGNNFAEALRESNLEHYPDHIRVVQFKDVSAVEWEELIKAAGAETKRLGFDALIVDTFAVFARLKGSEENDSGAVGDRMRVLRLVAQTYDIAVVLIRHAGKDGTPRGSSAFEAEADICITISRPEGRHAPTVRKLSGIGRYGEWERNIQLHEGRYISLGSDDRVEFRRAVHFAKAILPESSENGLTKREMLDKRQGEDQAIAARTLDRAVAWLVEQGDVGEKQLMNRPGKPKVYWLAYKPSGDSGGVSTKSQERHTGFGENKPNEGSEVTDICSRQTLSNTNDGGENKSGGARHSGKDILSSVATPAQSNAKEEGMTLGGEVSTPNHLITRNGQCGGGAAPVGRHDSPERG